MSTPDCAFCDRPAGGPAGPDKTPVCDRAECRDRASAQPPKAWAVWVPGKALETLLEQAAQAVDSDAELGLADRVSRARVTRHGRGFRATIRVDDGDDIRALATWLARGGGDRRQVARLRHAADELDDLLLEQALA